LFGQAEEDRDGYQHIIRVAFEAGVDSEFDYAVPDEIWPIEAGRRVEAPFGRNNKAEIGFCVKADVPVGESYAARKKERRLKRIIKLVDAQPLLDEGLLALARWVSDYYVCPLGQVLSAMVPAAVKKGAGARTQNYVYLAIQAGQPDEGSKHRLSKKQKQIVQFLQERAAFTPSAAVERRGLLDDVGCSEVPLKRLAEKQIIKTTQRTILKALPAIPEGMAISTNERIVLNADQRKALGHITAGINPQRFGVTLLHGVTDSGKTELYIRAIQEVLKQGRGAIVMLPEIALTTQTIQRFSSRLERIAVMHSGLKGPQRNVQWQNIRAGEADVVIGARSAVFAPLPRLGLIVIDEEHETSYKQDTTPRYNGRDVAIKRAQLQGAHCILGTATPSLETILNCRRKKYFSVVHLPKRVKNLPMPEMRLIDLRKSGFLRKQFGLISEPLEQQLRQVLQKNEQAILLLNRRGYSNFIFCPRCKHTLHCRNCDVTLTFHKSRLPSGGVWAERETVKGKHIASGYALCHYCLAQTLVPERCPLCGTGMVMFGLGSQRLEEEISNKFPSVRLTRLDSDSMRAQDYYKVLRDFSIGRIDILAGTQMLAKGLHFPNVTLVGIVSADTALWVPDFRANERTFQLISQVAGRAGRSVKKGVVFIQTFLPEQPAIQFALKHDYDGFVQAELRQRESCKLPPFWRLAVIGMRDAKYEKLTAAAEAMRQSIDTILSQDGFCVTVRGPMPAPISRIQRFHRMQIILQAPDAGPIQQLLARLRALGSIRPAVKVAIDVDPVSLL